jgi:hypothetical protein
MPLIWEFRMIVIVTTLSTLFYGWMASCCIVPQKRHPQPKRPDNVRGWKEAEFNGVHSVAELSLKKSESSDNGIIGVEVVEIISPDRCAEPNSYLGSPRVVLKFYRPSDRMKLCEATLIEGGSGLDSPTCDRHFGIAVIHINAINVDDGWVWFDLRK